MRARAVFNIEISTLLHEQSYEIHWEKLEVHQILLSVLVEVIL